MHEIRSEPLPNTLTCNINHQNNPFGMLTAGSQALVGAHLYREGLWFCQCLWSSGSLKRIMSGGWDLMGLVYDLSRTYEFKRDTVLFGGATWSIVALPIRLIHHFETRRITSTDCFCVRHATSSKRMERDTTSGIHEE